VVNQGRYPLLCQRRAADGVEQQAVTDQSNDQGPIGIPQLAGEQLVPVD